MTDKELRKLRRQDLLQLLLAQSREVARLQEELEHMNIELKTRQETDERLKRRLDDKDAQLERLKRRLDDKDARLEEMSVEIASLRGAADTRPEDVGSVADMANRIDDIFEEARREAARYMEELIGVKASRETRIHPAARREPTVTERPETAIPEHREAPAQEKREGPAEVIPLPTPVPVPVHEMHGMPEEPEGMHPLIERGRKNPAWIEPEKEAPPPAFDRDDAMGLARDLLKVGTAWLKKK